MSKIVNTVHLYGQLAVTRANTTYAIPSLAPLWLYTSGNYDPAPEVYLEVVHKISSGSYTARAGLYTAAGVLVTGSTLTTAQTNPTRQRSGDLAANLANGTSYQVRFSSSSASGTSTLYSARLVIIQNGTIVKTETIFEFGTNLASNSVSYANDTNKGIFYNDNDARDGTVAVYFEAFLSPSNANYTAYAQLADAGGGALSGSEVTRTGATSDALVRSGAITPADDTSYHVQIKTTNGNVRLRSARLIFVITNSPTKVETYYNMPYSAGGVTVETQYYQYIYWDDDEWVAAGGYSVFFESTIYASSSATAYADLNNGSTDIVTISTTSTSLLNRVRSDAFDPADNTQFDAQYRPSAGGTATSKIALLVVQAILVAPGTDTSDNQAAYLKGKNTAIDNQPSYLEGVLLSSSDNQPAYLKGQATATDNQPSYLKGKNTTLDSQPAYLKPLELPFTDNFNDVDGTSLQAHASYWILINAGAAIYSNNLTPNSGDGGGAHRLNIAANNDQYAEVVHTANYENSQTWIGPTVRSNASLMSFYYAAYIMSSGGNNYLRLGKYVGGGNSQLATYSVTLSPGDVYRVGAIGNKLYVWLNGSLVIGPYTDNSFSSGYLGITDSYPDGGVGIDSWSGGNLYSSADNQPCYLEGASLPTASDNQPVYLKGKDTAVDHQPAYLISSVNVLDSTPAFMRSATDKIFTENFSGFNDDPWDTTRWQTLNFTLGSDKKIWNNKGRVYLTTTGGQSNFAALVNTANSDTILVETTYQAFKGTGTIYPVLEVFFGDTWFDHDDPPNPFRYSVKIYQLGASITARVIIGGFERATYLISADPADTYHIEVLYEHHGQHGNVYARIWKDGDTRPHTIHVNYHDDPSYQIRYIGCRVNFGDGDATQYLDMDYFTVKDLTFKELILPHHTHGQAVEVDHELAYLKGTANTLDNQPAYLAGGIIATDNQPVYLNATGISASDSQSAYIKGQDNILDSQTAYLRGSIDVVDNQSVYLNGNATLVDNQVAYLVGQDTLSDNQTVFLQGIAGAIDSQAAYLKGKDTTSDNQPAFLHGQATAATPAIVIIDHETGDLSQYDEVQDPAGHFSVIPEAAQLGTNYGLAAVVDFPTSAFLMKNVGQGSIFTLWFNLDINSLAIDATGVVYTACIQQNGGSYQVALVVLVTKSGSSYVLNIAIRDDEEQWPVSDNVVITDENHGIGIILRKATSDTSRDGSLEWWLDGDSQGQFPGLNLYNFLDMDMRWVLGAYWQSASVSGTLYLDEIAITTGDIEAGSPLPAYLKGGLGITNDQSSYLSGKDVASSSQSCYLSGGVVLVDDQAAFTQGKDTLVDSQPSYLSGGLIVTGNQYAYLRGQITIEGTLSSLPFPFLPVIDDFNREDGELGANWLSPLEIGDPLVIISNKAAPEPPGVHNHYHGSSYWSTPFGGSMEVWVDGFNDPPLPTLLPADVQTLEIHFCIQSISPNRSDYGAVLSQQRVDASTYKYSVVLWETNDERSEDLLIEASLNQVVPYYFDAFGVRKIGDQISVYGKIHSGEWQLLLTGSDDTLSDGYAGLYLEEQVYDNYYNLSNWYSKIDNFGGGSLPNTRQPCYLQGTSNALDSQPVYLNGKADTLDNQEIYLLGRDTFSDNQPAYLLGTIDVTNNQQAYTSGKDEAFDSQQVYLQGFSSALDNQNIYLRGQDALSGSQSCYLFAGTFITSNQPVYLDSTGNPIANNQPAYIAGIATTSDSQPSYLAGGIIVVGDQPAYIKGQDTLSDNQPGYTSGEDVLEDNQSAYTKGKDALADNQLSYLTGGINITTSQSAYIAGSLSLSERQSAYLNGGLVVVNNTPAYLKGLDTTSDSQTAYIEGGAGVSRRGTPAYLHGIGTIAAHQSTYLRGSLFTLSVQSVYLTGIAGASSNQTVYLKGIASTSSTQPVYLKGYQTVSTGIHVYVTGDAHEQAHKAAYLRGWLDTSSNLHSYLQGHLGSASNQSAYLLGQATTSKHQSAFLVGKDTTSATQIAYLVGGVVVTDNLPTFMQVEATAVGSIPVCVVSGYPIVASTPAFTSGRSDEQGSTSVYLRGQAMVAAHQPCHIRAGPYVQDIIDIELTLSRQIDQELSLTRGIDTELSVQQQVDTELSLKREVETDLGVRRNINTEVDL